MYQVVEKFISINGEGNKAGCLAAFIRLKGCNLHCPYCDTVWANERTANAELMSQEEIQSFIKSSKISNVTLTGGEPLIHNRVYELISFLSSDSQVNIEVETNGSVCIEKYSKLNNRPSFTIDYKMSLEEESQMLTDNYKYLHADDTVKFVITKAGDLNRAKEVIDEYNIHSKCNVHFSVVFGSVNLMDVVDFMKLHRLENVKLQPQLHKVIWGCNKRGV